MPEESTTFTITPGTPTKVRVKDLDGTEYDITMALSVMRVQATGKKDPNNNTPVFELEFNVGMKTAPATGT